MGSPWLKSNWRHTCPGPELFLNTPSRLHPWFKKEDEERKGLKGIQGNGGEQGGVGGGGEVQHERDGRSDLVCCAFVSGICQVVRSIEAAEKLFVSVKVQTEHCHKTTLFPTQALQVKTLYARIEDKHMKLFSSTFSAPWLADVLWYIIYQPRGKNQDVLPENLNNFSVWDIGN